MKQRIKTILASLGIISSVFLAGFGMAPVEAIDPGFGACSGNSTSAICKARNNESLFRIMRNIINILTTVVGIVAVIMIVVGGLKYVTSGGDANGVASAKNTIIYAVIGLLLAIMSFSIVNFVLFRL